MKNLMKVAGLTAAIALFPSCASYKYMTIEPCLPRQDEDKPINRVINYFQKSDSLDTTKDNLIYPITKPDSDNLKIKFMRF